MISASVTILSRPECDNPEALRKHLPLPTLHTMQQQVEGGKLEWQKIVDERVKKKTRRFVSVSFSCCACGYFGFMLLAICASIIE